MDEREWCLTPHCCRTCLGRILDRAGRFRCADCGTASDRRMDAICGCGLTPPRAMAPRQLFSCGLIVIPTPRNLAEIVILFGNG